ncbi:MAG: hypothetical protein AAB370_07885 [Verrucomicrobiota bacterium]
MSIYQELRQQLPREFKITLSSFRGYSNDKLGFYEFKTQLNGRSDITRIEKRERFDAKVAEVDHLALILFTYALYLKFSYGDKAIKDAVSTFNSLGVKKVSVGALELSKESKYYNMGKDLAAGLLQCIENPSLVGLFRERVKFHEIAAWFERGR